MDKKDKSEFSEAEQELINQVLEDEINEERNLRIEENLRFEELTKKFNRHQADIIRGYKGQYEPFPHWELNEDFKSLKKADQWLLGWIYYISNKSLNYIQSFFYQGTTNPLQEIYNLFMFALIVLLPIALFVLLFVLLFIGLFGIVPFILLCILLLPMGLLIFWCLFFLWKVLDLTIGQTVIGSALIIWFSYLLIN